MTILITKGSKDYELLDSGNGKKLERYGHVVLSRPDPQVLWKKQKS
jgi:23S rRNA (cytosine1962-C5)-methyltransferase